MRPMSSRRQHPHFLLLGLPPFLLPILGLNPFAFLHVSLRDCRVPDVETFLAAVAEAVFVASGCRTEWVEEAAAESVNKGYEMVVSAQV